MTMSAKELKFCQGKTRSTLRSQRPRLYADYKKYRKQTLAPVNTSLPAIIGSGIVGRTLEVTMGIWNNEPTAYGAQWKRGGANITGATFRKYLLVAADSGQSITCTITAFTGGGQASVTTSPLAVA